MRCPFPLKLQFLKFKNQSLLIKSLKFCPQLGRFLTSITKDNFIPTSHWNKTRDKAFCSLYNPLSLVHAIQALPFNLLTDFQ